MTTPDDIGNILERLFEDIERERMKDVPVLNPALRVQAVGFKAWDAYWFGVLITPWFMNLMLLPRTDVEQIIDWKTAKVGSKYTKRFPSGEIEFILGHEQAIGPYLMSSLFSPLHDFGDQETAELTAKTVIKEVFKGTGSDDVSDPDHHMRQIWHGKVPTKTRARDETRGARSSHNDNAEPRILSRRELLSGFSTKDGSRTQ